MTEMNRHADRAMLDGLEKRGFRLSLGDEGSGWQFQDQNRGGGYCSDAGCSRMVIDGRVGLTQFDDIAQCRIVSKVPALQIAARERGLVA